MAAIIKQVLNVGGGPSRQLPALYNGWSQVLLDIDPAVKPDVCCDAKLLRTLKPGQYDAVYCSHNLEHFYRHEVPVVLDGMRHVLKPGGFVHIAVPDVLALMKAVVEGHRDIMDVWYPCGSGPIRFHDVLYGWHQAMAAGNLYYAHKCGFSVKSLTKALREAAFPSVYVATDGMNIEAYAFRTAPPLALRRKMGLSCQ